MNVRLILSWFRWSYEVAGRPRITDESQLDILTCWHPDGTKHIEWYHLAPDDKPYFGSSACYLGYDHAPE
jgi:hypothetical protein